MVIDPGDEATRILDCLKKEGLQLLYIINTHGHIDHIRANPEIKEATGARLGIHKLDAHYLNDPMLNGSLYFSLDCIGHQADFFLAEASVLKVDSIIFEIIHTPGHSPGSICLLSEDKLFTGDLLFQGSIGRSDLPGGNAKAMKESLRKIINLDQQLHIYPGHGPVTTLAEEIKYNPFLSGL